ncbi:MAG: OmpA family protein [Saprospiraceae bacterium]
MRNNLLPVAIVLAFLVHACSYTQRVSDGPTAFKVKQYSVAARMLEKEFKKAKTRIEKGKIALMIADSYRELNQSDKSIAWYQTAYDNNAGVDALREYAYALKKAERYDEAKQAFKDLGIEIGSPYEYRREIRACEIAEGWKNEKRRAYEVDLTDFNTGYADYSPMLYKDKQMIITSDRKGGTGDDTYNWTGNNFSDLYLVDLQSNTVNSFDKMLNTEDNEGTVAFSPDFQEIYFTRCFGPKKEDAFCKIMYSENKGNSWTVPRMVNFIENGVNYGHPSLSADGQKLYFSCNHPDGWGGYDIYVSERKGDSWDIPKLLGRTINTAGNEKFPYIDKDTLYFSSDYHPGMGGLDIFKSYNKGDNQWSPVQNLRPPINSGGDDFGLIIDEKAPKTGDLLQIGYFTSTREAGIGNDDIYRFEKRPLPPPPPVPEEEKKPIVYQMFLDGYVLEKIYEDPLDPNSRVLGRKPLNGATVDILIGKQKKQVTVGEDGLFSLELEEDMDYDFLAKLENYLNNKANFTTKGIGKDPENPIMRYEVEIVLDKIFLDKEIRLENIYYDFDRWEIRDDAKPTLNALIETLKLNPELRIQLSSHTDCRGVDRYNENLSQKRAQSAVDYLINNGIGADRLTPKGYGESIPEVNCICSRCTEEEHQENRRTTFKIIE